MTIKKCLVLFFLILYLFKGLHLEAQQAFMCTPSGIYELTDYATGTYAQLNIPCVSGQYQNLALYKDTLYFSDNLNGLYRYIPGQPNSCIALGNYGYGNAMTVDENGVLYIVGDNVLLRYDPHTNISTTLGILPGTSSGDLIFYQNKLFLAGYNGFSSCIFEVNISNPALSTVYMYTGMYSFFGLLSYPKACGKSKIFGLTPGSSTTSLVELDLDNKTIGGVATTINLSIYDAASTSETGYDDGIFTKLEITSPCTSFGNGSLNASAFFLVQGPIIYKLDNAFSNMTGNFPVVPTGIHVIQAISTNNCIIKDSFIITPVSTISVSVQKIDPENCQVKNGSIQLKTLPQGPSISYTLLNMGLRQSSGTFNNLGGGIYNFIIEDGAGCSKDTSVTLIEKDPTGCAVFVPSAFTPNNDGKNDVFRPLIAFYTTNLTMQIYNRWGQVVYSNEGQNVSWNGMGQDAGIYVYLIRYKGSDRNTKILRGTVALIR